MNSTVTTAEKSQMVLDYLRKRRSAPLKLLNTPAPSEEDIQAILEIAARVPDHGRLFPWYFLTFQGEARKKAGSIVRDIYAKKNRNATPAKLELEEKRFERAPLVIGVVSRARPGKHPLWEQILSAGAACQNLLIAANAMGYGANWLTEWYSYDEDFKKTIGLDERDRIAGFIFIGSIKEKPDERDRPDLKDIVTKWEQQEPIQKGDLYDREGFEIPPREF